MIAGDYVTATHLQDSTFRTVPIVGRLMSREEYLAHEAKFAADQEALDDAAATYDKLVAKGFRYAKWHSPWSPDGSLGFERDVALLPGGEAHFTAYVGQLTA